MAYQMDEIDERIIAMLREQGRRSNRDIARAIGVAEATVRNRTKRLMEEGIMQVVAVTNPLKRGYAMDVSFGLKVEFSKIDDVARSLAELEEVRLLAITVGEDDIRIAAIFRSHEHLSTFIADTLRSLPGILRVSTSEPVRLIKHTYDWMPVAGPEEECRTQALTEQGLGSNSELQPSRAALN